MNTTIDRRLGFNIDDNTIFIYTNMAKINIVILSIKIKTNKRT